MRETPKINVSPDAMRNSNIAFASPLRSWIARNCSASRPSCRVVRNRCLISGSIRAFTHIASMVTSPCDRWLRNVSYHSQQAGAIRLTAMRLMERHHPRQDTPPAWPDSAGAWGSSGTRGGARAREDTHAEPIPEPQIRTAKAGARRQAHQAPVWPACLRAHHQDQARAVRRRSRGLRRRPRAGHHRRLRRGGDRPAGALRPPRRRRPVRGSAPGIAGGAAVRPVPACGRHRGEPSHLSVAGDQPGPQQGVQLSGDEHRRQRQDRPSSSSCSAGRTRAEASGSPRSRSSSTTTTTRRPSPSKASASTTA